MSGEQTKKEKFRNVLSNKITGTVAGIRFTRKGTVYQMSLKQLKKQRRNTNINHINP